MKKLFLVLMCSGALFAAKAQKVQFGVKGGMNISRIVGDDAEDYYRGKPGFHIGGLVRIPVGEQFKVQPELVFSAQGAMSKGKLNGERINYNYNYLNLPAMFQYHTKVGFYAETGPQLGLLLSAKATYDGDSDSFRDDANQLDFSWGIGAGYHFTPAFGVNGRFNLGISRLDDDGDFKWHNQVMQASVFYVFGAK